MRRYVVIVPCLLALALAWATLPSHGQLDTDTCTPSGVFSELSAFVYGADFWKAQLPDVRARKRFAENYDQMNADRQAKIDKVISNAEASMNSMYEKYPNLAPSPAEIAAERLRTQADNIEAEEIRSIASESYRKKVPTLKRCEDVIVSRAQK